MRFRYLLIGCMFAVFASVGSSWAGGGDGLGVLVERLTRETELPHICKGGTDSGKTCSVTINNLGTGLDVEPPGCSGGGGCVVKFSSKPIQCRLSLHADTDLLPMGATEEAFETLTITLMVKKKGEAHFFANTIHVPSGEFSAVDTFEDLIITTMDPDSDKYLFRETNELSDELFFDVIDPDDSIGDGLRELFNTTGKPVISRVGKRIVESDHAADGDSLASLVVLKCKLRFVPSSGIFLPPPVITN